MKNQSKNHNNRDSTSTITSLSATTTTTTTTTTTMATSTNNDNGDDNLYLCHSKFDDDDFSDIITQMPSFTSFANLATKQQ
eukprot:Pgem_evm2s13436